MEKARTDGGGLGISWANMVGGSYFDLLDRQKWDKTLVPVRSRRPRPRPRPGPRPKYQVVTKDQTDVRDGWENEGETQERRDKRGASGVVTEHGLHWCVTGS